MKVAIFAHYDLGNVVDDYVIYYLSALMNYVDRLVVISNSKLNEQEQRKLIELGCEVTIRENKGYDFYAYKVGIELLDLNKIDQLILCNDSVYGPFYSLNDLFEKDYSAEIALWGITDSFEGKYHIQSYFLVFNQNLLQAPEFAEFWQNVMILEDKKAIIDRYEIGLSDYFIKCGFTAGVLIPAKNITTSKVMMHERLMAIKKSLKQLLTNGIPQNFWSKLFKIGTPRVNTSLHSGHELMAKNDAPFLKRAIFSTNTAHNDQVKSEIDHILEMKKYNFPMSLIDNHLTRVSERSDV